MITRIESASLLHDMVPAAAITIITFRVNYRVSCFTASCHITFLQMFGLVSAVRATSVYCAVQGDRKYRK